MKRKFVKTDYGMVIVREGDKTIHLDAEALAELYWEVQDEKIVRVVRCKDCKHYYPLTTKVFLPSMCEITKSRTEDNCFCAWGERREGETYETKPGVQIKI